MNPAELIAKENTAGVVAFAKKHGHDIPNDPAHAYHFLMQAWDSDPEAVKMAMPELHPHAMYMPTPKSRREKRNRFRNFDFSQYDMDGDDEYINEAIEILETGFARGQQYALNMANQNSNNNNQNQSILQPIKDHSKEILTYGAVLLAGIFIGKFLMK